MHSDGKKISLLLVAINFSIKFGPQPQAENYGS